MQKFDKLRTNPKLVYGLDYASFRRILASNSQNKNDYLDQSLEE